MSRRQRIALAGIVLGSLVLRAPLAPIPLERDEGEYAYIGARWLLGEVPYRDAFDQKPPGTPAAYAATLALAGRGSAIETRIAAIHWLGGASVAGTALATAWAALELGSPVAGLLGALLCATLLPDRAFLGQSANTETFLALFAMLALGAALRSRRLHSLPWAAAAGALGGAAMLCKQVAIFQVLFCVLLLSRASLRLAAAACAGLLLPIGATCAWFAARGALGDLAAATLGYNVSYVAANPVARQLRRLADALPPIAAVVWPAVLLAVVGGLRGGTAGRLAALWCLVSLAGVSIGGHFRPHYFTQAVPGLALLAGIGLASLPLRRPVGAIVAAAAAAMPLAVHPAYWLPGDPMRKARDLYGANPFPEMVTLGRLLAERSRPDDAVFVLGSEPQLPFYANLRSATRFIFVYPLTTGTPQALAFQREVLADLRKRPPRFVVTVFQASSLREAGRLDPDLFDSTRALLAEYRVIALSPYELADREPGALIAGEEAARLWAAHPFWYGAPPWASFVAWGRIR